MDPWRLATEGTARRISTLSRALALASCVLSWLAGFGSASTEHIGASVENAGVKSIVGTPRTISRRNYRAHGPYRRRPYWRTPPPAIVAMQRPPKPRHRKRPTRRQVWMSRSLLSWPRCRILRRCFRPKHQSAEGTQASTPDPAPAKAADTTAKPG